LQKFGDLEGILAAAAACTPPITRAKADTLLASADMLRATLSVVTLQPAQLSIPDSEPDAAALAALSERYGLDSTMRRWSA
jgi:hypothetical protein